MPGELYEILAQGASYWFAFLGVVIVWRSFAWLRKDGKARRKRVRQLPDSGLVGEMVVVAGCEELPEGTVLPLSPEGVMGSLRSCDVTLPVNGVAGKHVSYFFRPGKGMMIEPWLHQQVWVDGEELNGRRQGLMYHGSRLTLGDVTLRMRLFMGVDTGRMARREPVREYQPWQEPYEEAPWDDTGDDTGGG